ncbi:MAG: hypothetical protein KJ063_02220 [Anaerolineae bacterium]|nr:hypothetical protein [Anaerolineae bacterium]
MGHPNRLYNADFARDLTRWGVEGAAAFVPDEGYRELGAVSLPSPGSMISQPFSLGLGRAYMVEVAVKAAATAGSITLSIGNSSGVIFLWAVPVGTDWTLAAQRVGLPWGDYVLSLGHDDTAVYLDDVSVAWVAKTRLELATDVAERLGAVAVRAGFSTDGVEQNQEGAYSAAVDEGLRAVGAVDRAGRVDVRYLDEGLVTACLDQIELSMLKRLQRFWMTQTNYALGPRTEYVNQINASLLALTGAAVGGRSSTVGRNVKTRRLFHENKL